ncbi:MAG: D-aminoacyl-tRNA deacylase [Terriglobia bacterium]
MRAVVQRVLEARVEVDGTVVGSIGKGLLIYLGVSSRDGEPDVEHLVKKVLGLRIFEDETGKMNESVLQHGHELLIVSQFTLYGDCRKGFRPSYSEAAAPEAAKLLYDVFVARCAASPLRVESGVFQEMMKVQSVNDGPVTILLDSQKAF